MGETDTSLSLFGRNFRYPFFAGPVRVRASITATRTMISPRTIFPQKPARKTGIVAFTGDGINPEVMGAACHVIRNAGGLGIPTVKPWSGDVMDEKLADIKSSDAFAVAMDVDAAGLPFLKNMDPPAGRKSVQQLAEIIRDTGKPFIVKGIMTVRGALKAKEAALRPSSFPITEDVCWISALLRLKCFRRSWRR